MGRYRREGRVPAASDGKPPRPDRRRDRHGQDRHPEGAGRGLQRDGRAGVPGGHQGRPVRHVRGGRGDQAHPPQHR